MNVHVLFHDNCFDGAASAAVFSRFYRETQRRDVTFTYGGLAHKAGGSPIDPSEFKGDENAIVDFRYSQDPRLTWWFDHHRSAFQIAGDEAHFRADTSGKKFHDEKRKSCTRYLADIGREKFGFDPSPIAELLHWGELIDGAQFESPTMAVELKEPALRIMTVIEANKDPALPLWLIRQMQEKSLTDIAESPEIAEPLKPLLVRHQHAIEVVRKKIELKDGVLFFDVADENLDSINKFIAYYLYPEAAYTVWVGRSPARSKVSIGSNPWLPHLRRHDLSSIAEKYGGGGHPVVAAMSFDAKELPKARQAAAEILHQLRTT